MCPLLANEQNDQIPHYTRVQEFQVPHYPQGSPYPMDPDKQIEVTVGDKKYSVPARSVLLPALVYIPYHKYVSQLKDSKASQVQEHTNTLMMKMLADGHVGVERMRREADQQEGQQGGGVGVGGGGGDPPPPLLFLMHNKNDHDLDGKDHLAMQ